MVDWTAAATVQQAYSTFSEVNHIFCGFYIWDYIKDIRYEWSYIRRRRDKRSWMALCNIVCRLATLTSVSLLLALINLPRPSYCQAVWITLGLLSSLATLCALLIIAHRITLVWPSNRPVQVVVSFAWIAAVGSLLYGLLKARSAWDLRLGTCTVQDTACLRAPALILLVIDTLFVSLLLWGCYMLPSIAVMSFWTKLYRLGALPLAAAAMIQLAFTVCVFVDINDAMNLMFHAPALVMLSAASTRIYRVLEPYHNGLTHLSRVFVGTSFMTDPEMLFATNPAINRTIRSPRTSNTLEVDERDPSHARGAGSSSISLQPLKETTSLTQVRLCQSEADLSKPHTRTKSRML
ncbi:hypothetical protein PENSPDRAFT_655377 [Peniophora sp. CONT]|nr:hypothetical protein PENSPDRAFT_655377 [Peniophora sp. CONT]